MELVQWRFWRPLPRCYVAWHALPHLLSYAQSDLLLVATAVDHHATLLQLSSRHAQLVRIARADRSAHDHSGSFPIGNAPAFAHYDVATVQAMV